MIDSPCCTASESVRGPADEAFSELIRFCETFDPLAEAPPPTLRIKEVEPLREIRAAGFTAAQVAGALRVKAAAVEHWMESVQVFVGLEYSSAQALDWLLRIARRRIREGYPPVTTRSWWDSCQINLGWKRPRELFLKDPQRVRDSIKPLVSAKRIRTEPPGAKRLGWENLPGIFGT